MKKRLTACLSAFTLLFCLIPSALASQVSAFTVKGAIPDIERGTKKNIVFQVENGTSTNASAVTLSGFSGAGLTFYPSSASGTVELGDMARGASSQVSIEVEAAAFAAAYVPVEMTLTYRIPYFSPSGGLTYVERTQTLHMTIATTASQTALSGVYLTGARFTQPSLLPEGVVLLEVQTLLDPKLLQEGIALVIKGESILEGVFGYAAQGHPDGRITLPLTADSVTAVSDGVYAFSIPLKASALFQGGTYAFEASYTTLAGESQAFPFEVTLAKAEASENAPLLEVERIFQASQKPDAQGNIVFTAVVRNSGSAPSGEVKASLGGLSTGGFSQRGGGSIIIPSIEAGKTAEVSFTLYVLPSLGTASQSIELSLAYGEKTTKRSVLVFAAQPAVTPAPSPTPQAAARLILTDHRAIVPGGGEIIAGSTITLFFTLKNASPTLYAKNLTIDFDFGQAFQPTTGQRALFVESLAPDESIELSLEMTVMASAATQSYPIALLIKYALADGMTETREEISLPVIQPLRIEASGLSLYGMVMGGHSSLSIDLINKGRAECFNISMRVEGQFELANDTSQFFGNLSPGSKGSTELLLKPLELGEKTSTLIISFEDANGQTQTMSLPFEANVTEPTPTPAPTLSPDDNTQGFSGQILWYAGGALAAVVLALVLTRRHAARRSRIRDIEKELDD